MAGSDNKTEKPSGKKIDKARGQGHVAKSREMNMALTCLAGTLGLYLFTGSITQHSQALFHRLWGALIYQSSADELDRELFLIIANHFFSMITPIAILVMALAITANAAQVKWLIAWEAIRPKFSRINPLGGLKNLFSPRSFVEMVKSLLKMALLTWVVYYPIQARYPTFFPLVRADLNDIAQITGGLALEILLRSSLLMLLLSILDFAYQKWRYQKDLMMTKQEVKEEHKQAEGNPQIKSKIRSIQRALMRQRMMAKVPKATVVITNPTHYAVALLYEKQMEAPRVLAKGRNLLAHKIIGIARKHRVPVVHNPPLARALYKNVELDEQIPLNLYRAVAKVLAYVFQQRRQAGGP
jgi:flagellar biosynthesis protein FlhB